MAWRLWGHLTAVVDRSASPLVWSGVVVLAAVYPGMGLLMAWAWRKVLAGLGDSRLSWREAWRLHAKTQIAKYLPGNVFHLAGRHLAARERGVGHGTLATAAGLEAGMVLLSAGVLSLFAIEGLRPVFDRLAELPLVGSMVFCVLALAGMLVFWRTKIMSLLRRSDWRRLAQAQLGYGLFMVLSALLFAAACLLGGVDGKTLAENWRLLLGGYACSWAAGFVVPGAPGGLGIREAVLVAVLGGTLGESGTLLAAVLFRLVTTLGDGLFFLLPGLVASGVREGGEKVDLSTDKTIE